MRSIASRRSTALFGCIVALLGGTIVATAKDGSQAGFSSATTHSGRVKSSSVSKETASVVTRESDVQERKPRKMRLFISSYYSDDEENDEEDDNNNLNDSEEDLLTGEGSNNFSLLTASETETEEPQNTIDSASKGGPAARFFKLQNISRTSELIMVLAAYFIVFLCLVIWQCVIVPFTLASPKSANETADNIETETNTNNDNSNGADNNNENDNPEVEMTSGEKKNKVKSFLKSMEKKTKVKGSWDDIDITDEQNDFHEIV